MKNRLKLIRKEAGLTQVKFAEALGLSLQSIKAYESGTNTPGSSTVYRICDTYKISERWLRTGEGDMHIQMPRRAQVLDLITSLMIDSPEDVRLAIVELLVGRPDKDWRVVSDMIQQAAAFIQKK